MLAISLYIEQYSPSQIMKNMGFLAEKVIIIVYRC